MFIIFDVIPFDIQKKKENIKIPINYNVLYQNVIEFYFQGYKTC